MSRTSFILAAGTLVAVLACSYGVASIGARVSKSRTHDLEAIDELHRRDVVATLSGDPGALAELWTDDAVRLEQGSDADIGKRAIRASDEHQRATHPGSRILTYQPEIKDVTIADGWAFEWGYFTGTYADAASANPIPFRAKLLRVLKKQSDGSWRFARVMWNTSE
jgi:uncharacterized protein (TIGR02246 family)